MPRVIFMDDDRVRLKAFKRKVPVAELVETAANTIKLLKELKTDDEVQLFLDHDLGGETYVDSNREDCGMEVVRWIEANLPTQVIEIFVHSHNTPAAEAMVNKLRDSGYKAVHIPFMYLIRLISQGE